MTIFKYFLTKATKLVLLLVIYLIIDFIRTNQSLSTRTINVNEYTNT